MNPDLKKKLVQAVPYGIIWYLADKVGSVYRIAEGSQAGEKLVYTFLHFGDAFTEKLPSFHPQDMLVGLIGALIVRGIVYYRSKNAKKYRQGVEYGSARWSA